VSCRLHTWIDLLFGACLSGPAAVAAKNVHLPPPAPHRPAARGMCQLFEHPHPPRDCPAARRPRGGGGDASGGGQGMSLAAGAQLTAAMVALTSFQMAAHLGAGALTQPQQPAGAGKARGPRPAATPAAGLAAGVPAGGGGGGGGAERGVPAPLEAGGAAGSGGGGALPAAFAADLRSVCCLAVQLYLGGPVVPGLGGPVVPGGACAADWDADEAGRWRRAVRACPASVQAFADRCWAGGEQAGQLLGSCDLFPPWFGQAHAWLAGVMSQRAPLPAAAADPPPAACCSGSSDSSGGGGAAAGAWRPADPLAALAAALAPEALRALAAAPGALRLCLPVVRWLLAAGLLGRDDFARQGAAFSTLERALRRDQPAAGSAAAAAAANPTASGGGGSCHTAASQAGGGTAGGAVGPPSLCRGAPSGGAPCCPVAPCASAASRSAAALDAARAAFAALPEHLTPPQLAAHLLPLWQVRQELGGGGERRRGGGGGGG
jgi:hypothetical protein